MTDFNEGFLETIYIYGNKLGLRPFEMIILKTAATTRFFGGGGVTVEAY